MLPEPYNYILAAFGIDFEGSISFRVHEAKTYNNGYRFVKAIEITNTRLELLEAFKEKVGFGCISPSHLRTKIRAASFSWHLNVNEIREHLSKIETYLTIKNEQALYLIRVMQILKSRVEISQFLHNGETLYTIDEIHELFYIAQQMEILNQRESKKQPLPTAAELLYRELRKR